jgi:SAM-dependent methyltransferase
MEPDQDLQSRTRQEADFHDARIVEEHEGGRLGYAYVSVADVYRATDVPPDRRGSSVLEIGCFRGQEASALAPFNGRYVGIDISPAAIEYCRKLSLAANFRFSVDDANSLSTIPDSSVDYAFGNGVLHHLDLELFASSFAKKLSRGGYGRFIEPAQGNFLLRAFRKATPQLRTPDERPFDGVTLSILSKHLSVEVSYFALLRPFIPMLLLNNVAATKFCRWADTQLLQYAAFQRQAWLLCITLRSKSRA